MGEPAETARADTLNFQWRGALEGKPDARTGWTPGHGQWSWRGDGAEVRSSGHEWSELVWQLTQDHALRALENFVISVTVAGKAQAAGISFGDFKDFLVEVTPDGGPRRLQLEVDCKAGAWAFRVDGQLKTRHWWDSAVNGVDDIAGARLSFKARHVDEVVFRDFEIHRFDSSCRLSVIITCFRFQQRLRVTLRNWCHQDLPTGAHEVLVANPGSPDGTAELLAAVSRSYPHVRVREVPVAPALALNKGAMINQAVAQSRGDWVWLTDADCLFAPHAASLVLSKVDGNPRHLYFGERHYLDAAQTDALLSGRLDGLRDYDFLWQQPRARGPERLPWGYCQITHGAVLRQVRYVESVNHFAHSDNKFIEDCKRLNVTPRQIEGLSCLHLDHPFAWYGTNAFL